MYGSSGIRLAMGYGGGGPPSPYTSVLSELGYDFLFVDGNCHYWAHQPSVVVDELAQWRPYREGVLAPVDEQRLHDAVSYDGVPTDACAPPEPVFDAGAAFLWNGREGSPCADDIYVASGSLRLELYEAATAVTGPMRIQVGKDSYPDPRVVYDWPLAMPVEQFVIDYEETTSFRVDDVAAVAALRSLREQVMAGAEASPAAFPGLVAIRSSGSNETYYMSMRDELPFVDADGRWQPAP